MKDENEQIKIEDESGDRKYFTQIPNIVINHSSASEQSLYLVMKRLAGEHGICFASLRYLSVKMHADRKTVKATIDKLLKRGWISETESKVVQGGEVRQFKITDIWKENLNKYESDGNSPSFESEGISPRSDGNSATKKNYKKNEVNITKKEIYNEIFTLWNTQKVIVHREINPHIKKSIDKAIGIYNVDEIKTMIIVYATVLHGSEYYWTHRWNLNIFLDRGLKQFDGMSPEDFLTDGIGDPRYKIKDGKIIQE